MTVRFLHDLMLVWRTCLQATLDKKYTASVPVAVCEQLKKKRREVDAGSVGLKFEESAFARSG